MAKGGTKVEKDLCCNSSPEKIWTPVQGNESRQVLEDWDVNDYPLTMA